jgi:hypothetical protein
MPEKSVYDLCNRLKVDRIKAIISYFSLLPSAFTALTIRNNS